MRTTVLREARLASAKTIAETGGLGQICDFERIIEDLKKSHKVNQKTRRRLLERVLAEELACGEGSADPSAMLCRRGCGKKKRQTIEGASPQPS